MHYITVRAKRIETELFDENGKVYKLINFGNCCNRGYYLLMSQGDKFVVLRQLSKNIKFPYHIQRRLIDYLKANYPKRKTLIRKEQSLL